MGIYDQCPISPFWQHLYGGCPRFFQTKQKDSAACFSALLFPQNIDENFKVEGIVRHFHGFPKKICMQRLILKNTECQGRSVERMHQCRLEISVDVFYYY